MADIPANHQKPEEFTPSRPGDDVEPVTGMTAEEWAEANKKALDAEAKAAKAATAAKPAPAAGGQEG